MAETADKQNDSIWPSRRDLRDALFDALAGTAENGALERAATVAETTGDRLELVLSRLGIVSEDRIAAAMAELAGAVRVKLASETPDPDLVATLGQAFCARALVLPLAGAGPLRVALVDPRDRDILELVRLRLNRTAIPVIATPGEIEDALRALKETPQDLPEADPTADLAQLRDLASDAPVVRTVTQIIRQAAEMGASDIHFEPFPRETLLRYRVDGALRDAEPPPVSMRPAIVSRLKLMAHLDIAETRLPQDGRIKTVVAGRELDMRVATTPTLHGEGVVIRLLDRSGLTLDFPGLGFDKAAEEAFRRLITQPHGIVLVTGPTGSGKTTTLYAGLAAINDRSRKIVTVEDPVEYQMPAVTQIQVKPGIGLGFAEALRSILRQDPDIIMIGEIRDLETARIAVQAALTGHLVLATLHTNSAAAAINRLRDMGVPDYLLAATVSGALAQRLVRRLCSCAVPDPHGDTVASRLGVQGGDWRAPGGCEVCAGTGYKGRTTLIEVLQVNDDIRGQILAGADEKDIEAAASASGMRTLARHGAERATAGDTSLAEILRVTAGV